MSRIEQFALSAVTDMVLRSPQLVTFVSQNDKTPVTDGHIDVHSGPELSNATLLGRVPVQVKGRTTGRKTKQKTSVSFSVERDVLRFFRTDGGGIYFYVPVSADGKKRTVFYAVLTPFKIDRLLRGKDPKQKSFTVRFERLPKDPSQIERIAGLALEGQKQGKTVGGEEDILERARGITLHLLSEISPDRPTVLDLEKTDFAVTVETNSGLNLPYDMDLTIYPASYMPREIEVTISCGEAIYTRSVIQQVAEETVAITLSQGLEIRTSSGPKELNANINLTPAGGIRSQLRDLDFFLAAMHGEPLIIAGAAHPPTATMAVDDRLGVLRERIASLVELMDALAVHESLIESHVFSDGEKRELLSLHRAIVRGEEVEAQTDGYGRYDFEFGKLKIVTLIAPGSTPAHRRILDPLNPGNRSQVRIIHARDDGSSVELDYATVYDSMEIPDLVAGLNLRLEAIVETYEGVSDNDAVRGTANQMTLTLLRAADSAEGPRREYLLSGAASLSEWLVSKGGDVLPNKINRWQVGYRRGTLSPSDRAEIRAARRALYQDADKDVRLREACLLILLEERDELDLVMQELTQPEADSLRSWPIWSLVERDLKAGSH